MSLKFHIEKGIKCCRIYLQEKRKAQLIAELTPHLYITAPCFGLSLKPPFKPVS